MFYWIFLALNPALTLYKYAPFLFTLPCIIVIDSDRKKTNKKAQALETAAAKDQGGRPAFSVLPPGLQMGKFIALERMRTLCADCEKREGRALMQQWLSGLLQKGRRQPRRRHSGEAWCRLIATEPRDPLRCPVLTWLEMVRRWGHNTEKLDSPSQQIQRTMSQRSTELRRRSPEFLPNSVTV